MSKEKSPDEQVTREDMITAIKAAQDKLHALKKMSPEELRNVDVAGVAVNEIRNRLGITNNSQEPK